MKRLFVAIPLPELLAQQLVLLQGGIPGARWEPAEKLHLTLHFIGETDAGHMRRLEAGLRRIQAAPFSLALRGVGHFPPRGQPRVVWAGVDAPPDLVQLHARVGRMLEEEGAEIERRKFAPHVTLARLRDAPAAKVAEFIVHHNLFSTPPFAVDRFTLMSSVRGPRGSSYREEASFPLAPA